MKKKKYDVVVVGAGIGGLVCGCYLAKAGLKVIIIEQHDKLGGYCTSFSRKGYRFDVGVHYLGSLKNGILRYILDELEINFATKQTDPSDKIITPDQITFIWSNPQNTIQEFAKNFPNERCNIKNFFDFILFNNFSDIYRRAKKLTFRQILDEFFDDYKLKAILSLLLGNIALSAEDAAAVPAIILFREYILDSGYYPIGGMQVFPNKIGEQISKYNGTLLLGQRVVKVVSKEKPLRVILANGDELITDIVVSNVDATQLFTELLDVSAKESVMVDKLVCSPSMFLVYLGVKINLEKTLKDYSNIWYFSTNKIHETYSYMKNNVFLDELPCLMCSFPSLHDNGVNNKHTLTLFIHAPFKTKRFWEENKKKVGENMISKISTLIPNLQNCIDVEEYATPHTFYRYTLNRNGSFVGWLATLEQTNSVLMPQKTSVEGVYLVGHWCTMGYPGQGGIPNVAFSGRRAARLILQEKGKKWVFGEIKL